MHPEKTIDKTQYQWLDRRLKNTDATTPQQAIDDTAHCLRQSLIINELIKDRAMTSIKRCCSYLSKSREAIHKPSLHWLLVLTLLLLFPGMIYLLLQCG